MNSPPIFTPKVREQTGVASRRICVLVLGMHRSGTSALTRVLSIAGAKLPSTLLGANESNETGHWESQALLSCHDRLLGSLGSDWEDWRPLEIDRLPASERKEIKTEIADLLRLEFGGAGLFVLKDPRICRFADLYLETLADADIAVRIVHAVRNPLEVAESLHRRNGTLRADAMLQWLRHVLDSEAATRAHERVVVAFGALVSDWRGVFDRITSGLDLAWPYSAEEISGQVEAFLDAKRFHHRHTTEELLLDPGVGRWVEQAYSALLVLTRSPRSKTAMAALDAVRAEFDRVAPVLFQFRAEWRDDAGRQRAALRSLLDDANAGLKQAAAAAGQDRQEIASLGGALAYERALHKEAWEAAAQDAQGARQRIAGLRGELAAANARADRSEAEIAERDRQLAEVKSALAASQAAAHEHMSRASDLDAALKQKLSDGAALEAELEDRERRLSALTAQLGDAERQAGELQRRAAEAEADIASKVASEREACRLELAAVRESDRLTAVLSEREREAAELNRQLEEARAQSVALGVRLGEKDAELRRLESEKSTILSEAHRRRRELIEHFRGSTSWKLTRPVRFAGDLLKSLGRDTRRPTGDAEPQQDRRSVAGDHAGAPALDADPGSSARRPLVSPSSRAAELARHDHADQIVGHLQLNRGYSLEYVPKIAEKISFERCPVRTVAFYLPQFHPIPENDRWWGAGFTEWTNVTKAVPQFVGHYQPHLPGELGFYDLRLVDVMRQQIALAKQYGISAFCFHHYWFAGKRLLDRPVRQFLEAEDIDFPFCLCWANENWTRRWDGMEHDVLIAQKHSPQDDIAFIDDVIPAFRDRRYLRFEGRPILIVYRVSMLPDAAATADRWRKRCKEAGVGNPYLVVARSFDITDPRPFGFDAAVEFPPHQVAPRRLNDSVRIINPEYKGTIYDYGDIAEAFCAQEDMPYPLIKTVMTNWDNEARKPGAGHTFYGSSPAAYAKWLRRVLVDTVRRRETTPSSPPFVFINAWNEWAEGAHLEPDRRYGYAYLHTTANLLRNITPVDPEVSAIVADTQAGFRKRSDVAIVAHIHYDDLFPEMLRYVRNVPGSDVFISVRSDISLEACRRIVGSFPGCRLAIFENRGRDIQPFLAHHRLLSQLGYEVACKIHAKKSTHRADGTNLRQGALSDLLGTNARAGDVIRRFRTEPSLGLLSPAGALLNLEEPDLHAFNRAWLDKLLARAGHGDLAGSYRFKFVAGSMFWYRVAALKDLRRLAIDASDFEEELGQVDGTLAHALERMMGLIAERAGFSIGEV